MLESSFEIDTGPAESALSAAGSNVDDVAMKNMQTAMLVLEGEIKRRAPVRTGYLRSSYEGDAERTSSGVIGFVGTDVDYAVPQEFIYTPHVRPAIDAQRSNLRRIVGENTMRETLGYIVQR